MASSAGSGALRPSRATLRFRSMVTLSCSSRSTPKIPSIGPPQALAIALKSTAGSFTSSRRRLPSRSSEIKTSCAVAALVPFQDEISTCLERPAGNDLTFNMDVAAVSTRKRISLLSACTTTTGRRSQRSSGISDGGLCCARTFPATASTMVSALVAITPFQRSLIWTLNRSSC